MRDMLGLTHVLNRVRTASPVSRKRLLQAEHFDCSDRDVRIRYFKNMKRLNDVKSSQSMQYDQTVADLSDLRDISATVQKLREGVELDAADLFSLKKHVVLEQRLLTRPNVLKAAGVKLVDHAKVLALLSGSRPSDIFAPVRLALSDFDDAELKKQRRMAAELTLALADAADTGAADTMLERIAAVEAIVAAQEKRALVWLSKHLLPHAAGLAGNLDACVTLDLMLAKLNFAAETASESVVMDNGRLAFIDALHPEEEARLKTGGSRFTPLTGTMRPGVTVVQGANMSGKSVALNTFMLNALLVNMGFYPFAAAARVPLFDAYIWIGDVKGDRAQGLSTFGAEVGDIRTAVNQATAERVLLVIDEPFRGTNPVEGRLLASGLAAYLDTLDSFAMLSTHYSLIGETRYKRYRSGDIDVPDGLTADYEQAARELAKRVDYQLKDISGETAIPQKAIAIAGWLGLQEGILQAALRLKEQSAENMNGNLKSE